MRGFGGVLAVPDLGFAAISAAQIRRRRSRGGEQQLVDTAAGAAARSPGETLTRQVVKDGGLTIKHTQAGAEICLRWRGDRRRQQQLSPDRADSTRGLRGQSDFCTGGLDIPERSRCPGRAGAQLPDGTRQIRARTVIPRPGAGLRPS